MIEVRQHDAFRTWLGGLRDDRAKARVAERVRRLTVGSFGDTKSVGDGVSELRIDYGPGYRVYYTRREQVVVILLCGGDKDSQDRDIRRAKELARDLE